MEQLISLVMDNIYVVVIIVGIIYSLFSRKSPIERRPKRMPDIEGGGRPRPSGSGEIRTHTGASAPVNRIPAPAGQQSPHMPAEQPVWIGTRQQEGMGAESEVHVHALLGASKELLDNGAVKPARRTQQKAIQPQSQPKKTASEAVINRDDLTRAIMWAEILGPPRARRPHRR